MRILLYVCAAQRPALTTLRYHGPWNSHIKSTRPAKTGRMQDTSKQNGVIKAYPLLASSNDPDRFDLDIRVPPMILSYYRLLMFV